MQGSVQSECIYSLCDEMEREPRSPPCPNQELTPLSLWFCLVLPQPPSQIGWGVSGLDPAAEIGPCRRIWLTLCWSLGIPRSFTVGEGLERARCMLWWGKDERSFRALWPSWKLPRMRLVDRIIFKQLQGQYRTNTNVLNCRFGGCLKAGHDITEQYSFHGWSKWQCILAVLIW